MLVCGCVFQLLCSGEIANSTRICSRLAVSVVHNHNGGTGAVPVILVIHEGVHSLFCDYTTRRSYLCHEQSASGDEFAAV